MTEETERHNIAHGALDCWCQPIYLLPCNECDGGCWKCEDGTIELTREEAERRIGSGLIIIHQSDSEI